MRVTELKGALTVWQAFDMEYSPGLGFVIVELSTALVSAQNEAHSRWDKDQKPR